MSLLDAIVPDGPLKGFPLEAAMAIDAGEVTPKEAKAKLIEAYEKQKLDAIAACDAAITATKALPDEIKTN